MALRNKKQKRVLMLVENSPYPRDVRVKNEAETLQENGYQVRVVAQGKKGESWRENVNGVEVYRYPAPPDLPSFIGFAFEYGYSYLTAFVLTAYIFLRHGFDAIHAANPPDIYAFLAIFYKPFGVKYIFDHHDLTPEVFQALYDGDGNKRVYNVLLFMERFSLRVADRVIATNQSYRKRQMELHGVPAEKIAIVRNGPNLKQFVPVPSDPELRAKAGTIIGYAGSMGKQDGIDYLVRAMGHLVHDLGETDTYCVLMGSGAQEDNLKALTKELKLEEHIWFPGWMQPDRLIEILSTADICAGPDPKNSFNDHSTMIKLMEYMAMGKPIVSFDLTESIYSAKNAAIYVENNDEMAFAKAIQDLMHDPAKREQMGEIGQERIYNALAWKYSAGNLLQLYSGLFPSMAKTASTSVNTQNLQPEKSPQ